MTASHSNLPGDYASNLKFRQAFKAGLSLQCYGAAWTVQPTAGHETAAATRPFIGTVCADKWGMNLIGTRISHRRALLVVLWLGYVLAACSYLLLVSYKSGVLQTKRQQLINESPLVWVAPFGIHYHQESHYSRHLSSPISLYEATERGYSYCDICHPPRPAQLLRSPVWVRHWLLILFAATGSLLILTLVVLYKTRSRRPL